MFYSFVNAISGEHFYKSHLEKRPDANIFITREAYSSRALHVKVGVAFGSANKVIRALLFPLVMSKSMLNKYHPSVHSEVVI